MNCVVNHSCHKLYRLKCHFYKGNDLKKSEYLLKLG